MEKTKNKAATRLAASHFAKFTTELIGSAVQKHDISIIDMAIIALIYAESTRPIRDNAYLASKYGFDDRSLPNEYRPTVNLKYIYTSLGLSRETARRKLENLVERGFVNRVEGGYVLLAPSVDDDFIQQLRVKLLQNIDEISKRVRQVERAD